MVHKQGGNYKKKEPMYRYLTTQLLGHNPTSTRYVTGSPGLPQRGSRPLEQTYVQPHEEICCRFRTSYSVKVCTLNL
jgi:hypothetical protein